MNWVKAIGYGIVLFAVMFLLGSLAMFGLKLSGNAMGITMLILSIIVLWLLSQQYGIKSLNNGLLVGLVWLVIDVVLENIVIVQMFNKGVVGAFYSWSVLTGYLLVLLIPGVYGYLKK